ncbi:MAG TPA: glycosyltransferase family 87 protein [Bradyrhizobium sp.]|nr:glycosyltransferase family 87 protein [Bradyrhizobium sp.]
MDQAAKISPLPQGSDAGLLMNTARLRLVAWFWIGLAGAAYAFDLLQQTKDGLSNGIGRPFGDDFVNYWSAPFLALHGRVAEIYDFAAFHAFEQSVTSQSIQYYHYSYPPVMLLLTLPLALIPYVPALFVWLGTTWYAFYRALKLVGGEGALLLSLATPALFVNAMGGQNGALTAALLCGGLMLLDRRPVIAGILFGCFAYKPQLALMLPFALIAGRRWLTVVATGTTAMLLVAVSVALFGLQCWFDYAHNLGILRTVILEDGSGVAHRMVSVFVFARMLGATVPVAYLVQAIFAGLAVVVVARSWWQDDPAPIRNALTIMGTCFMTPYLQDYDLVMGAFVVLWLLMVEARSRLPAQWFRLAAALILVLPAVSAPFAKSFGLSIAPLFLLPAFVLLICTRTEFGRGGTGVNFVRTAE